MHSLFSDGIDAMEYMAEYASILGREYIAFTDHARYIDDVDAYLRAAERIEEVEVLAGVEVNILYDGSLEVPDKIPGL